MNEQIAFGGKLFLRALIGAALAAIIYLSVGFIFTSFGTKVIGYEIYKSDNGEMTKVGTYYYDELSDLESEASSIAETSETSGSAETTYYKQSIRSDMPMWLKVLSFIISEICMLGTYLSMLYVSVWEKGKKDHHLVVYGKEKEDMNSGLKSGLWSALPLGAMFVLLILCKCGWFAPDFAWKFKLMMFPYFPIMNALIPTADVAAMHWYALPIILALMTIRPLICMWGYRMGYREKTLKNTLFYTKKKKKKF